MTDQLLTGTYLNLVWGGAYIIIRSCMTRLGVTSVSHYLVLVRRSFHVKLILRHMFSC